MLSSTAFGAAKSKTPLPIPPACDRECLRGTLTQVLYSLVEHDTTKLQVSSALRVTEDAVEKPLDKVALTCSVTKLRG